MAVKINKATGDITAGVNVDIDIPTETVVMIAAVFMLAAAVLIIFNNIVKKTI